MDNNKNDMGSSRLSRRMDRRSEEERKLKRQSRIRAVTLIAVAAVCVLVLGGKQLNKYLDKNGTYLMIGDHKIDRAEFDYYSKTSYNNFINSYGSYASYFGLDTSKSLDSQYYTEKLTWQDYFDEQAVDSMKSIYALYDTGKAAGYDYDPSKTVKEEIDSIKSQAEENKQDADEYVKSLFGDYATLDKVESYMMTSDYASSYYDKIDKETKVSDDEVNDYYKSHKDEYDEVNYLICDIKADVPETEAETEAETAAAETAAQTETLSESESVAESEKESEQTKKAMDKAKAKANEMLSAVTDEKSFKDVYKKYAEDASSDPLHEGERSSAISNSEVSEWLFDSDRKAGDKTVIEDTDANEYSVVLFLKRYRDETKTVDFRHILIQPETTETTSADQTQAAVTAASESETESETLSESESIAESESEAKAKAQADADAKKKAEKIYDKWKKAGATEKTFEKYAKKYSQDTGSQENGGLYEQTTKGSMTTEVDDWIFDPARKPGDNALIHTTYGYHIMYYVGDNKPAWFNEAKNTLKSEKMDEFMKKIEKNYEVVEKRAKLNYMKVQKESESEGETSVDTETEKK